MLYKLCSEGKPLASHHVVSKPRQSKHGYQLLHHQHLWSLFLADPPRGPQRCGGVHRYCREQLRTSRMLHSAQRQRYDRNATALIVQIKKPRLRVISFSFFVFLIQSEETNGISEYRLFIQHRMCSLLFTHQLSSSKYKSKTSHSYRPKFVKF